MARHRRRLLKLHHYQRMSAKGPEVQERRELQAIFDKYGTDKSHHGYHEFYAEALKPHREESCNIVEIGVQESKSLKAWLEYFSKAFVYGLDLLQPSVGERYEILKWDQSSRSEIESAAARIGTARVIIDDGSHVPEHQLLTFNILFTSVLEEGGVYILEDVETSYWRKGSLYGYNINAGENSSKSIVNIFSAAIHRTVNRLYSQNSETVGLDPAASACIESLSFGKNYISIRKGPARPSCQLYHFTHYVRG